MNHILVGSALPFLIGSLLYLLNGRRASVRGLILTPLAMAVCSTWAVAPDLPRIVGWHSLDQRLASTNPWIDIFFWHHTINLHETTCTWYNVAFVGMLAGLFLAAWRELRIAEQRAPRRPDQSG
jgi:hypothetical protein